ncbi:hypothetical protein [Mycoplasmopsis cricetuli]|uniref:hypothetical protein n=1 Tax=Mycoplasmopsis cricetuli TaxID=171283 RepID=UPI0012EC5656|nr:hypothetical protein [Mycoplasmopsis cricetuli]
MIFFHYDDFNNNLEIETTVINSLRIKIGINLEKILFGIWPAIQLLNNFLLIVTKKKLNLTDYISATKLVLANKKEFLKNKEQKLKPYFKELPKFEYIDN